MHQAVLVRRAEELAAVFAMLGNAKRLAIMSFLAHGEMSVGTIAGVVGLSQSALSQHLAKLRACGLVTTRRERQMIFYCCVDGPIRELLRSTETIFHNAPSAGLPEGGIADG